MEEKNRYSKSAHLTKKIVYGRVIGGTGIESDKEPYILYNDTEGFDFVTKGHLAIVFYRDKTTFASIVTVLKVDEVVTEKNAVNKTISNYTKDSEPLLPIISVEKNVSKNRIKNILDKWDLFENEIKEERLISATQTQLSI